MDPAKKRKYKEKKNNLEIPANGTKRLIKQFVNIRYEKATRIRDIHYQNYLHN